MQHSDNRAEHCLHTGISDRAEYRLYSRGKKIPCVNNDQASARVHSLKVRARLGVGFLQEAGHGIKVRPDDQKPDGTVARAVAIDANL